MHWGLECGEGWRGILDWFGAETVRIKKEYDVQIITTQVKEKFGTLRIYYSTEYGPRWIEETLDGKTELPTSYMGWTRLGAKAAPNKVVTDAIEELVNMTERMSGLVCEACGTTINVARRCPAGWVFTQCDACTTLVERKAKRCQTWYYKAWTTLSFQCWLLRNKFQCWNRDRKKKS
jgi:hypothetical protein